MKKDIEDMIALLKSGYYDQENTHAEYDMLLERFIQDYKPELLGLIIELIHTEKDFWYA
jgi:hypothetical protein